LGFLSGGEEVAVESVGLEVWLTINRERIAKRGRLGSNYAKKWVPLARGWSVTNTNHAPEIEIRFSGTKIDWSGRTWS
jgi:hypothetical protein